MRDFRPFLQLVHVSDLHLTAPGYPGWPAVRALARAIRAQDPERAARLERAAAPHDPAALEPFARLLEALTLGDPLWRRLPTWLADSGDAVTFGDAPSLALARSVHRELAARGGVRARLELPGNHAHWPGAPPCAAPQRLAAQRESVALDWHPTAWPAPPLIERPPTGRPAVQLYALDTGDDGALAPDAPRRLRGLIAQHDDGAPALRVVLVHHPLGERARALPVHLVLAGHRHALFPAHGALATAGDGPLELCVGSLCLRAPAARSREPWAQHAQVLRFYHSPARPRAVLLERLVAARAGGVGPFRLVPLPGTREVAEERMFSL